MNFAFTPEQEELRALARRVFTDRCTPEHLKKIASDLSPEETSAIFGGTASRVYGLG